MLKTLVLARFQAMFYRKPSGKKKKKQNMLPVYIILGIYLIVVFGGLFYGNYSTFYITFCDEMGADYAYFAIASFVSVLLGFIGSVMMTQSQLYEAKDNEMLLALPIKSSTILLSRIIVLYVWAFVFSTINILMALVVYLVNSGFDAGVLAVAVIEMITVPLLAMALGFVIAWLLKLLTSRMKNKAMFNTIGTLIFFGFYMVFCMRMYNMVMAVTARANEVVYVFHKKLLLFEICGKAITQTTFLNVLLMLIITVAPFALAMYILSRTFIKIATTKSGVAKTEYKAERAKVSSVKIAIAKKEVKHFISSTTYAVNGGVGLLMMVASAVYMGIKGDSFSSMVYEIAGVTLPPSFMIALCIIMVSSIGTMAEVTACAISLEGNNLWILKTAPIAPIDVLKGKIYGHLMITTPFTVIAGIALNFMSDMNILERIIALLLPTVMQIFTAYFGLAVNLRIPKLDWSNEAQAIKQSGAAFVCVFGGMGLIILLAVLFIFCYSFLGADVLLVLVTLIFAAGSGLYEIYLHKKGTKRYLDL